VVIPNKSLIKCILNRRHVKRGIKAAEMPIDSMAERLRFAAA
jgi:hypothetical protein